MKHIYLVFVIVALIGCSADDVDTTPETLPDSGIPFDISLVYGDGPNDNRTLYQADFLRGKDEPEPPINLTSTLGINNYTHFFSLTDHILEFSQHTEIEHQYISKNLETDEIVRFACDYGVAQDQCSAILSNGKYFAVFSAFVQGGGKITIYDPAHNIINNFQKNYLFDSSDYGRNATIYGDYLILRHEVPAMGFIEVKLDIINLKNGSLILDSYDLEDYLSVVVKENELVLIAEGGKYRTINYAGNTIKEVESSNLVGLRDVSSRPYTNEYIYSAWTDIESLYPDLVPSVYYFETDEHSIFGSGPLIDFFGTNQLTIIDAYVKPNLGMAAMIVQYSTNIDGTGQQNYALIFMNTSGEILYNKGLEGLATIHLN